MREFKHHKYTWMNRFGSPTHTWSLVCSKGGVHFHAHENSEYGDTAGLEIHTLEGEGAPDHIDCWLTGGRCWHDGTSSYATDTLWPIISAMIPDHEAIFTVLEGEARERFKLGEPS